MSVDEKPLERSARKPPPRVAPAGVRGKHRPVDPRFDPLFGSIGAAQLNQYKFIEEQQAEEQVARRRRMKQLKCILRRFALEEAEENLEEYDLSDVEREQFCEGIDASDEKGISAALRELRRLKLTHPQHIREELSRLQAEENKYRSIVGGRRSISVKRAAKDHIKAEIRTVKEGKKAKPFFLKRKALKSKVLELRFDALEGSGGKLKVDKYLEKKSRRR